MTSARQTNRRHRGAKALSALGAALFAFLFFAPSAFAKPSESTIKKAKKLYFMLTGVHLQDEDPIRDALITAIESGDLQGAAKEITDPRSGSAYFYNGVIRAFASTWNQTEAANGIATGITANLIGITRDDLPYDTILTGNFYYRDPSSPQGYSDDNDEHFNYIDTRSNFRDKLVKTIRGNTDIGIFTTRSFAVDYYFMGTKRRPWKAIVELLYCTPLPAVKSLIIPDAYVRRDVPRVINGTTTLYRNDCRGCHSRMDAVSFAFSAYDSDGTRLTRLNSPTERVNEENGTFYKPTPSEVDAWALYSLFDDATFGFKDVPAQGGLPAMTFTTVADGVRVVRGRGLHDLARVIAESRGFPRCLATRAVSQVYLKKVWSLTNMTPEDLERIAQQSAVIERLTDSLMEHRSLRRLFEETALEYLK